MSRNNSGAFVLSTQLWVPRKRPDVFALFADAFQLERLTPPWLRFRVLTQSPIEMHKGRFIDYQLRLHGFPVRWRTEITGWEPPFRFQDSQIRGPYSLWTHTHTFEEVDGGTLVRDRVVYRVLGGSLVNRLFVQGDLRRIFRYRHEQLPELLGVSEAECERGEIAISREWEADQSALVS
jgi:ligand-binding SRPBCC domain-containing protein